MYDYRVNMYDYSYYSNSPKAKNYKSRRIPEGKGVRLRTELESSPNFPRRSTFPLPFPEICIG